MPVAVPVIAPGQWDDEDQEDGDIKDSWDMEDEETPAVTTQQPIKKKKTLAQKIAERKEEEERKKAEFIKVLPRSLLIFRHKDLRVKRILNVKKDSENKCWNLIYKILKISLEVWPLDLSL